MKQYKFCPFCGIGLSTAENQVHYCQNCKTDFSERATEEQIEMDDYEDSLWEDDDPDYDEEYEKERQEDEDAERAADCTCGAWIISKTTGEVLHVADCCCGRGD